MSYNLIYNKIIYSLYYAAMVQFGEQGDYKYDYFGHKNCVPGNLWYIQLSPDIFKLIITKLFRQM